MRILIKICLLCLLFFFNSTIYGQDKWLKIYHDEIDAPVEGIIETYDNGYLLLGRYGPNYPKQMWLAKTDVNGEILWEKTIGDGLNSFALMEINQNNHGYLYMCGISSKNDPSGDPIIIQLNECGEKTWCKEYHSYGNQDFAKCLALTNDGGCAVTLNSTGSVSWMDRTCLTRLTEDGQVSWTQCYNSQDTSLKSEEEHNLITTPDEGFLISGHTYYEDPLHPDLYWLKPYFIKVDSLGNFEWETIVHKDVSDVGGQAWYTALSPDSMYYYSSISHYYHDNNTSSPALLKMDMDGNIVDIYNLVSDYKIGKLFRAIFINDSSLAASASWRNPGDDTCQQALIIDTLGNIRKSRILTNEVYLSYIVNTFNDKLLYFTEIHPDDHFDALLYKLNYSLEDDSIYSFPYKYDTLCPHQIESDTIVQDDCGLIVGDLELPTPKKESNALEIYPNPATNQINCIVHHSFSEGGSIWIYDMLGGIADVMQVPSGQTEIQIDISDYTPGIYIAVVKSEKEIIGKEKFIKK